MARRGKKKLQTPKRRSAIPAALRSPMFRPRIRENGRAYTRNALTKNARDWLKLGGFE